MTFQKKLLALLAVSFAATPLCAYDYFKHWEITEKMMLGKAMLLKAMDATKHTDYAAVIKKPFKGMPQITEGRFYRHYSAEKDMAFIRLECFDDNGLAFIFLRNADGQYVYSVKHDYWLKGGDFNLIFHLENLHNRFCLNEMTYNDYTIEEEEFNGIPCWKVSARLQKDLPRDRLAYQCLSGILSFRTEEDYLQFEKQHPYNRQFWFGKDDYIIRQRRHSNKQYTLLYIASLGDVTFNPDWSAYPSIFDSPEKVVGCIQNEGRFYQYEKFMDIPYEKRLEMLESYVAEQKKKSKDPHLIIHKREKQPK